MSHMNVKHLSRSIQWPFLRLKSYLTWADTQKKWQFLKTFGRRFLVNSVMARTVYIQTVIEQHVQCSSVTYQKTLVCV